ncbi:unnamed protein product [Prorocentrum cordatum]|uniref:Uncharacterized protein n=1 Tax=Prorocentrum cordatum TaxID=2364126 RepID=A0ABN9V5N3_9DINO|nr:unnamed protein product [Polarella glacialis]
MPKKAPTQQKPTPSQSVMGIEVACTMFAVRLRFITDPSLDAVSVNPMASAMRSCLKNCAEMVFCTRVMEPPPMPKMKRPTSIKQYWNSGPAMCSDAPMANTICPMVYRAQKTEQPTCVP